MAMYLEREKLREAFKKSKMKNKNVALFITEMQPIADVAEVTHGEWHILSDDPYDESGVPTEEGWYRIITADGQETTDYFFQ